MRAVVKYGQGDGEVELREVPEPTIGPQDVLVETQAAGVCGSDIEMWHHDVTFRVNTPVIQGHEFSGIIREVGREVQGFAVGDRVVSETAAYICGRCRYCLTGEYNLCPERLGFGYGTDGAFARYVRVPARCLHRIPEGVSFEHAALTEPACVAYNALVVKSRIRPGEPVLVIGPGPIGLFCVQIARLSGASPILLVGTEGDGKRLAVGRQIGAEVAVASAEEALAALQEVSEGYGAPLVVDAAGNSAALRLALEAVARNGQITKIGWGPAPVGFSLDLLLTKAATLQGTYSHTWRTWEAILSLLKTDALQMEPMITHQMGIEDWERAYRLVESREAVKVLLWPEG
ncbi:MAG TPA: Zn-dependent alcohol dehydrogenase [Armatimonadetes bacterium]|nr:Zn-dependent alcohol dehydrogenase [Armatimonadota bacterium]